MVLPVRSPRRHWADALVALALALGVLVVYVATIQGRLWGDGPALLDLYEWEQRAWWRTWSHVLHTPIALAGRALGPFELAHDDYVLASAIPAALGTWAAFALARRLGAGRIAAASGVLLVALSPVLWFFATLLEVHATHAGVVALCAWASVALAEKVGGRAFVVLHGLLFLVVCLSHLTAVTLVPLWALLGWFARVRTSERGAGSNAAIVPRRVARAALPHMVLGVVAFALAMGVAQLAHYRFEAANPDGVAKVSDMIVGSVHATSWTYLVDDWIEPLSWALVPLALLFVLCCLPGARARVPFDVRGWCAVLFVGGAPAFAFYMVWALPNDGGYVAGFLPFVAVAIALLPRALASPNLRAVAAFGLTLLLVPQALAGYAEVTHNAREFVRFKGPERVAAFASLADGPTLVIGMDTLGRPLGWDIEGVEEIDLVRELRGLSDERIRARIAHVLDERVVPFDGPVYVDTTYRQWIVPAGPRNALFATFEQELLARFEHRTVTGTGWPIARLLPRDRAR